MPARVGPRHRILTTLTWPVGVAWTTWHYMWRTLPVHRVEDAGSRDDHDAPALPSVVARDEIQVPEDGSGPLLHRRYTCTVTGAEMSAARLMEIISADPDRITPRRIARFRKTRGSEGEMVAGDEFLVQMPGPWNGPVRAVDVRAEGFRFATLAGHLEAGQIEWRAWEDADGLHFAVESWARGGDRLSALMHDRLRMAKEVQLYMWTSVLQRVPEVSGGRLRDGVHVRTWRVPPEAFGAAR